MVLFKFYSVFCCTASIFGDPHFITFDDVEYTFNGKGEFVLVHADTDKYKLDVQARFEQVDRNIYGPVMATQLTSVVGKQSIKKKFHILKQTHVKSELRQKKISYSKSNSNF